MIKVMDARQLAMSDKLDRMVEAMESIAAQRVEIAHLVEQHRDTRKWLKGHEVRLQAQERMPDQTKEISEIKSRVGKLEKLPGKNAGKAMWMLYGAGLGAGSSVVSGLVVFWLVH